MTLTTDPTPSVPEAPAVTADRRFAHYELLMTMYRHHFDLFVKCYTVYVLGAIALLAATTSTSLSESFHAPVLGFTAFLSFLVVVASIASGVWIKRINRHLFLLEQEIGLLHVTVSGTTLLATLGALLAGVLCLAALLLWSRVV